MLAQKLYEGVELGPEGSVGLITYMRTDSTRVSDTALGEVRDYIGRQYGDNYLPEKAVYYRSKKDAQDAHEAIRPTEVARTPDSLAKYLKPEELKLYRLIWQRFVASQMMPRCSIRRRSTSTPDASSFAPLVRCRSLTAS